MCCRLQIIENIIVFYFQMSYFTMLSKNEQCMQGMIKIIYLQLFFESFVVYNTCNFPYFFDLLQEIKIIVTLSEP